MQSEYRKIRTKNNSVFGHFSSSGNLSKTLLLKLMKLKYELFVSH